MNFLRDCTSRISAKTLSAEREGGEIEEEEEEEAEEEVEEGEEEVPVVASITTLAHLLLSFFLLLSFLKNPLLLFCLCLVV